MSSRTVTTAPTADWGTIPEGGYVTLPGAVGGSMHYLGWLPGAGTGATSAGAVRPSPEDPVILLVHGIGNYSAAFEFLGPTLANAGFCVLAPDLLGHGRSRLPGSGVADRRVRFDADAHNSQLAGFLDLLGVHRPVVIIGHSMGGGVVTAFAAAHPSQVRAVGLVSPGGLMAPGPIPCLRCCCGCCWRCWCPLACLKCLTGMGEENVYKNDWANWEAAKHFDWSAEQGRMQRRHNPDFAATFIGNVMEFPVIGLDDTVDELVAVAKAGAFDLPVLLLFGENDSVVPFESNFSAWATRLGPTATTATFKECGHLPFLEQKDGAEAALLGWLAPLQAAAGGSGEGARAISSLRSRSSSGGAAAQQQRAGSAGKRADSAGSTGSKIYMV